MTQLKNYPRLWKNKYLQEFICKKDKRDKYYGTPKDEDRFMNLFEDHKQDVENGETMFQFFKRSIIKQKTIRILIKGIVEQTNAQMTY